MRMKTFIFIFLTFFFLHIISFSSPHSSSTTSSPPSISSPHSSSSTSFPPSFSSSSSNSNSLLKLNQSYYGYQYGSKGNDYSTSIYLNKYLYILGNTNETLYNKSYGLQDIIISKYYYLNNNEIIWKKQYGSKSIDVGIGIISKDNNNDIYITGYTTGYIYQNYSSNTIYISYETTDTNNAMQNYYLYEFELCEGQSSIITACPYYWGSSKNSPYFKLYDSSGNIVQQMAYLNCDYDIYVKNYFSRCETYSLHLGCIGFESCSATIAVIINSYPPYVYEKSVDTFISRHNHTNGELIWGLQIGTSSIEVPNDIDVSINDNSVYIVGYTNGALYNYKSTTSIFVSKVNTSNGQLIWGYQNSSRFETYGTSIIVDDNDNGVYVLGYTYGNMFTESLGGYDIIIFKLDSNKQIIFSVQYGTKDDDYPLDMAKSNSGDNQNYLYVCGYTERFSAKDYSFLYKLDSKNGNIIWKKKNELKYDWSMSIMNSSIYITSITKNNQYQLSKYNSNSGEKYWDADITNLPNSYTRYPTDSYSNDVIPTNNNNNIVKPSVMIDLNENIRITGSISGNVYNKSYGNIDYFILAPNICKGGYYSNNYINECQICPKHYYANDASNKCKKCNRGYDSDQGSSTCYKCYGGFYHNNYSECFHTSDKFLFYMLILIFPLSILTISLIIISWTNIGYAFTALLSTSDLLSDILYITTTFFYSSALFYSALFLLFPPLIQLIVEIIWKVYQGKGQLRMFHTPKFLKKFNNYLIIWIILWIFNLLFWCLILLPYLIFTLSFGYYLLQTKLLSLPYYEKLWDNICFVNHKLNEETENNNNNNNNNNDNLGNDTFMNTSTRKTKIRSKESINTHSLNKTVMIEIIFESIPQIIIQTTNNILMKSFGTIALISLIVSILMIVNSLYRILYYYLYHGISLSKIPLPFNNGKVKTKFPKLNKLLNTTQSEDCDNKLDESLLFDRQSNISSSLVELSPSTSFIIQDNKNNNTNHDKNNKDDDDDDDIRNSNENQDKNLTPITIKLNMGAHDITFKQRRFDNDDKLTLEVFLVEKESPLELLNLIGYIVTEINGINYYDSPIQLSSKFCSENCEVTLHPPKKNVIKLKLSKQIQSFEDIGVIMSIRKTFFHDINLYYIESILPNSIAESSGLTPGYHLISVNNQYFYKQINEILFGTKKKFTFTTLLSNLFISMKSNIISENETINEIENHVEQLEKQEQEEEQEQESKVLYELVFKKPISIELVDKLSFYQEILNDHLRSIGFLLFKIVSGRPMIGSIPFFYRNTRIDNFGLLILYFISWFGIFIIHQIWIPIWITLLILNFIFSIPFIIFWTDYIDEFITLFTSIIQYCLLFIAQFYLTILFACSIAYVSNQMIFLWIFTTCIMSLSFIGVISIYLPSINFLSTSMILGLSFLQILFKKPKYLALFFTMKELGRLYSVILFTLTLIQFIRYIIWNYCCYCKNKTNN